VAEIMHAARPAGTTFLCSLALMLAITACGERPAAKKSDVTVADVIAGVAQSFDHFESSEGKFAVDFPQLWKNNYTFVAHADTAYGSRFIVDFRCKPDPKWNVEPRTVLVVRIFPRAAWAKVEATKGQTVGVKLKERGDDVFVLSIAGSNPYRAGTPPATLFEQMMFAVIRDSVPLRVTPR
jgi:hypothetical protein